MNIQKIFADIFDNKPVDFSSGSERSQQVLQQTILAACVLYARKHQANLDQNSDLNAQLRSQKHSTLAAMLVLANGLGVGEEAKALILLHLPQASEQDVTIDEDLGAGAKGLIHDLAIECIPPRKIEGYLLEDGEVVHKEKVVEQITLSDDIKDHANKIAKKLVAIPDMKSLSVAELVELFELISCLNKLTNEYLKQQGHLVIDINTLADIIPNVLGPEFKDNSDELLEKLKYLIQFFSSTFKPDAAQYSEGSMAIADKMSVEFANGSQYLLFMLINNDTLARQKKNTKVQLDSEKESKVRFQVLMKTALGEQSAPQLLEILSKLQRPNMQRNSQLLLELGKYADELDAQPEIYEYARAYIELNARSQDILDYDEQRHEFKGVMREIAAKPQDAPVIEQMDELEEQVAELLPKAAATLYDTVNEACIPGASPKQENLQLKRGTEVFRAAREDYFAIKEGKLDDLKSDALIEKLDQTKPSHSKIAGALLGFSGACITALGAGLVVIGLLTLPFGLPLVGAGAGIIGIGLGVCRSAQTIYNKAKDEDANVGRMQHTLTDFVKEAVADKTDQVMILRSESIANGCNNQLYQQQSMLTAAAGQIQVESSKGGDNPSDQAFNKTKKPKKHAFQDIGSFWAPRQSSSCVKEVSSQSKQDEQMSILIK